jgi:hypothetical protein
MAGTDGAIEPRGDLELRERGRQQLPNVANRFQPPG